MSTHTTTIEIWSGDIESSDGPCAGNETHPLSDVIAWFTECMARVPEEYRASARCKFSHTDFASYLTIEFERPETDDERMRRETNEASAHDWGLRRARDTMRDYIARYPELREELK